MNLNEISEKFLVRKPNKHPTFDENTNSTRTKKVKNYIYNFDALLGQGNFSKVFRGRNELTNENVAIKIIQLCSVTSSKLEELLNSQISILKKISHPNVVKCHEVLSSTRNCYIITELCQDGDLGTILKKKTKNRMMSQEQVKPIARDVYCGLKYLAKCKIVHRDLKIANIFISEGRAKIADFGFAKFYSCQFTDVSIGSPIYMSPEGFNQSLYGPKTDVWAFGILLYELTHGFSPFSHCKNESQLSQKLSMQLKIQNLNEQISAQLKQLIISCLNINEKNRISIENIEQSAWMQQIKANSSKTEEQEKVAMNLMLTANKSFFDFQKKAQSILPGAILPGAIKQSLSQQNPQKQFFSPQYKTIKNLDKNKRCFKDQLKVKGQVQPLKMSWNSTSAKLTQNIAKNSSFYSKAKQSELLTCNKSVDFSSTNSATASPLNQNTYKFITSYTSERQNPLLSKQIKKVNICQYRNSTEPEVKANELWIDANFEKAKVEQKSSFFSKKCQSLLTGSIKFNECIGIVHYCRLFYRTINLLQSSENKQNQELQVFMNWILIVLRKIVKKVESQQIIYENNKTTKELKIKTVLQEYIKRYKKQFYLQKQINEKSQIKIVDCIERNLARSHSLCQSDNFLNEQMLILCYSFAVLKSATEKLFKSTQILEKQNSPKIGPVEEHYNQNFGYFQNNSELIEAIDIKKNCKLLEIQNKYFKLTCKGHQNLSSCFSNSYEYIFKESDPNRLSEMQPQKKQLKVNKYSSLNENISINLSSDFKGTDLKSSENKKNKKQTKEKCMENISAVFFIR